MYLKNKAVMQTILWRAS